MTGSMIKRGDQTYLLRLSLGRDKVTGKRLYRTETVHGTKKEAEARLRDLINEYDRGITSSPSKQSLNEFLLHWLESKQANIKARTIQDYTGVWKRYLRDGIGRLPLDKLSPSEIQKRYDAMVAQGLSPLTVRRLHTVLHQALARAVKWRMLSANPAADLELPSLKRRRVARALTVEQAQAFLQACHQHRLGAAFRLALETGMRPQEYTALQWSDIDFAGQAVRVTKTLFFPKGGGWRLEEDTKTDLSCRGVALSAEALEELRQHRTQQLQERLFLGPDWKGSGHDFVFTNGQGGPISPVILTRAFKQILQAAKLPNLRVYDLRHSHATLLLQGGVAPKVASERLGHSTITLTMDTYSHVLPSMQREAASKVSSILRPAKGEPPTDSRITS